MGTFRKGYEQLIKRIERTYEISLTLGEKVSLRYCLAYSQQVSLGRSLEEPFGEFQKNEAELMWLRQYGISLQDVEAFEDLPQFREYIRRVRDSCLLL